MSTSRSALRLTRQQRVEVCLLDCDEASAAAEAVATIAAGAVRVLALLPASFAAQDEARVVAAGATVCLSKGRGAEDVLAALRALVDEAPGPGLERQVQSPPRLDASGRSAHPPKMKLTPREREVLEGLVHGDSTERLAARLGVQPATARKHIERLLAKLNVHSRSAAVTYAIRHGLVQP